MSNESLVGGWTGYGPLTPEDKRVFEETMEGFVGVHYTPEKVSTQLVNGTNYRYLCDANIPVMPLTWQAIVEIHAPIKGKPFIMSIHRL